MRRIVLGYSGGLDTSVAIPWLQEKYGAEIVAITLDLGQAHALNQIRDRAVSAGAIRCHVLDVREELARDYLIPALQADAVDRNGCPLATALSGPLIAKKLVDIARMENATAIAHGCSGDRSRPVRIDVCARALDPAITVIAPAREWGLTRSEAVTYARGRGMSVPATIAGAHKINQNLWGRSIECGALEDAGNESPDDIYTVTQSPANAPAAPACVEVEWQEGVPTAINGVDMPLVPLIESLDTIGGVHGVGRIDIIKDHGSGGKLREIYEGPAAMLLHASHRALERLVVSGDLQRLKARLSHDYADIVSSGLWFSQARSAIDAFMKDVQAHVTGTVRMQLNKGDCHVIARKSPFALYDEGLAADGDGDKVVHPGAAFITIREIPVERASNPQPRAASHAVRAAVRVAKHR